MCMSSMFGSWQGIKSLVSESSLDFATSFLVLVLIIDVIYSSH